MVMHEPMCQRRNGAQEPNMNQNAMVAPIVRTLWSLILIYLLFNYIVDYLSY